MEKVEVKNKLGKVFYTAEYDAKNNLIYGNWMGFANVEDVMLGAETYLEFLKKVGCPYLVNDNSQLTGPWNKANEWIANDWTPRAIQAGLKYFAHVTSTNIFAELSAKEMEIMVGGFNMKIFKDVTSAKDWLKQYMSN